MNISLLPNQLFNLCMSLIPELKFQEFFELDHWDRFCEAKKFHGPSFLDKLAFDSESFLCHFLPTIITNFPVPSFVPALFQVPLYFQSTNTLNFGVVSY